MHSPCWCVIPIGNGASAPLVPESLIPEFCEYRYRIRLTGKIDLD